MATPTAAPAGDDDKKTKKKRHFLSAPSATYIPTGSGWWGAAAASVDGKPVFTPLDVPRMMRDPQVIFIADMWCAPFQRIKFKCRAEKEPVANFVQNTVRRFWKQSLGPILRRYFECGFGAGCAEYRPHKGFVRLDRVREVECRDANPRVYATDDPHGRWHRGQFAGFDLTGGGAGAFVGTPHAFWFAGMARYGPFYDRAPLSGLFEPWLEKNGRNGANHLRQLWFRKHAADGGLMRYPDGTTNMGTDESPQTRNNADIARELLDYKETMSTMVLVNDKQPGVNGGGDGDYEWDYTPAQGHPDVAGFLDYPERLDDLMLKGAGIPKELIAGSESGSGYNGRMVPLQGFLGKVDELANVVVRATDSWLRPLVEVNFGADDWYEVETVSLADQLEQEQTDKQKRSGELPAKPGAGGDLPFQLSALESGPRYAGPGWHRTEDGDYVRWDRARPKRAALSLAATADPNDDPNKKAEAFDAVTSRLSRSRKSTITQLLALAMIRAQQRATAAGKPDAAAGSLEGLAELAGDPVQVAKIVGMKLDGTEMSALELAWSPVTTARGTQAAESDSIVDPKTGKPKRLYGKAAQAALASQQRRMDRDDAERISKDIIKRVAKGKVTPEEVQQLAKTLPSLRNETLTKYRKHVEANLRSPRKKQWMVQRLLDHVATSNDAKEAIPHDLRVPSSAKGASRNPSKSKYAGTVTQSVMHFGGIDPNDSFVQKELGGLKQAVANGIPLVAFRSARGGWGTRGVDQMAKELQSSGHLVVPDDAHSPEEYLMEQILKGAKANGNEDDGEKAYNQRAKGMEEDGGEVSAEDKARLARHYDPDYDPFADADADAPAAKTIVTNDKGYPAEWDDPVATETDTGDVAEVVSGTDTEAEPVPAKKEDAGDPPLPTMTAEERDRATAELMKQYPAAAGGEQNDAKAPAKPAPKTGADRIAALKAKRAGRADPVAPKDVPAPVAKEVAKQVEAPAPKDGGEKPVDRRKRTDADPDAEVNKFHVGIAHNELLDAVRRMDEPLGEGETKATRKQAVKRLHTDAKKLAANLPEALRARYLARIEKAAKGEGKMLPRASDEYLKKLANRAPDGPLEDVDPTEAVPTEADDKAAEQLRAALGGAQEPGTVGAKDLEAMDKLLADAPDPDEEPEVAVPQDETGIERKARLATEAHDKALALFNNPTTPKKDRPGAHTIKRLRDAMESARAVAAAEARRTGKPSPVAGILKEEQDRLARLKAMKVTDTAESRAARERLRKANAAEEPADEPEPAAAPPAPPEPPPPADDPFGSDQPRTVGDGVVHSLRSAAKALGITPEQAKAEFDAGRLRGYRIPGDDTPNIPAEMLDQYRSKHAKPAGGVRALNADRPTALRDEDGNVLLPPTAEEQRAEFERKRAADAARLTQQQEGFNRAFDRQAEYLKTAKPAMHVNGYRIVKNPDLDKYHVLDENGDAFAEGTLSRVKRAANEAEPAKEPPAPAPAGKKKAPKPKTPADTVKVLAPDVDALASRPLADKEQLKQFIDSAPTPKAKELLEDAEWNMGPETVADRWEPKNAGKAVRRHTVEQLGVSWRVAHEQGMTAEADYLATVLGHYGARVSERGVGEEVPFDPAQHASAKPISTGRRVKVTRPAVVLPEQTGDYVVEKGLVEPV